MTRANKIWLLSSGHRILENLGSKTAGSRNGIHEKLAPHAYHEDDGRKDKGQALLDRGSTPPMFNDDNPTVMDTMTPVVSKDEGTYRTSSE
jgi:hypothetical protein